MSHSQHLSFALVPGRNVYLEMQMLGTIVSSVAYGVVLMLSYNCLALFSVEKSPTKKMRVFLNIFVVTLLLLSTSSFIQGALITSMAIFLDSVFPSLYGGATYALPVTIWMTDSFMIHALFSGRNLVSCILRQAPHKYAFELPAMLTTIIGSAVPLFMNIPRRFPSILFVALSTGLNILITLLIVLRLSYHQNYLRSVLGNGYSSPYSRVITLTIESAALNLFIQIPYLILVGLQSVGRSAFILTLPHIPIIATLLIIYRVAQGRAETRMEPKSIPDLVKSRQPSPHSGIYFQKTSSRALISTGTEGDAVQDED
ncbi:hypothetical protein CVT25_003662 [Psilocybe cyanescens]|uniref:Uncharacterized protein n=1 Tax=Psilocybe cyanescens TaxID=93625 RepID=A0A409XQY1_PSICY|nr:hypothetical protein CVT25_003662 [Psilocybe cyanescens]